MPTYNPNTLQRYADALYVRAYLSVVFYGFIGWLVGNGLLRLPNQGMLNPLGANSIWLSTLAFAGIGWARSFMLRVEAQRLLCLMAIEENTRNSFDE